jgi:amino acid transporter
MGKKSYSFETNGKDRDATNVTSVVPVVNRRASSSSEGEDKIELKKELGLLNGIGIIVGIIIGSGIFVSPKGVLQEVGSVGASLLVWVGCGIISLIGALCYAELGTSIPQSGGDYAYIKTAFGPLPAFLFLWVALFVIMPAGNAIASLTLANYALVPFCSNPGDNAIRGLAAASVLLLTFINCYNVRLATLVQDSFAGAKVFALALIISAGAYHVTTPFVKDSLGGNNTTDPTISEFSNSSIDTDHSVFKKWINDPWDNMQYDISKIALSFYSGLFSFAGWNYLNFVTEELKDPYRNLPRAIYISLPTVTIIYVLANIAYFSVLSPETVLESPTIAISFGRIVFPPWVSWLMPLFVSLSALGGLNGCILASSRLLFVGAREGHLPSFLAMINIHYFTPVPALVFLGILTLSYLCITDVYSLINYTAFSESLFVTFSVGALLWLRWKQPALHRPIKVCY